MPGWLGSISSSHCRGDQRNARAGTSGHGRSALSVPSDESEFLTSTNPDERDFRIGTLVALTGNIASGKTEVARIFADLGATVIDADELAREVVRPGTPALAAIASRWGEHVLLPDGTLDRAALRSIVFSSPAERAELNAIVHPEVRKRRDQLVAEAKARGDVLVIAAIPLLFEAGLERDFDRVILVDAPDDIRLERLVHLRGMDVDEAKRMMAAQMPAAAKRRRVDIVIDNDSTLQALREAVERAFAQLTSENPNERAGLPPQKHQQ